MVAPIKVREQEIGIRQKRADSQGQNEIVKGKMR
jgi:hypothetical protein